MNYKTDVELKDETICRKPSRVEIDAGRKPAVT